MRLQRNFLFLILLIILSCHSSNGRKEAPVSYPKDLDKFYKNVLEYYLNQKIEDVEIAKLLSDLKEDGSFSSIDYTNRIRSDWPVKEHLKYVQDLAIRYKNESSKYYLDKSLSENIHKGLNYWLNNDFLSPNWHNQHIGVPKLLLPTLFLIKNKLTKNQIDSGKVFPKTGNINFSTNILEGSWNKVVKRYRPFLLTAHIFKLWFNNGSQPKNKSYRYMLVLNTTQDKMLRLHKNKPFNIINTKQQHSLESLDKTQAGIVFYKHGTSKIKEVFV